MSFNTPGMLFAHHANNYVNGLDNGTSPNSSNGTIDENFDKAVTYLKGINQAIAWMQALVEKLTTLRASPNGQAHGAATDTEISSLGRRIERYQNIRAALITQWQNAGRDLAAQAAAPAAPSVGTPNTQSLNRFLPQISNTDPDRATKAFDNAIAFLAHVKTLADQNAITGQQADLQAMFWRTDMNATPFTIMSHHTNNSLAGLAVSTYPPLSAISSTELATRFANAQRYYAACAGAIDKAQALVGALTDLLQNPNAQALRDQIQTNINILKGNIDNLTSTRKDLRDKWAAIGYNLDTGTTPQDISSGSAELGLDADLPPEQVIVGALNIINTYTNQINTARSTSQTGFIQLPAQMLNTLSGICMLIGTGEYSTPLRQSAMAVVAGLSHVDAIDLNALPTQTGNILLEPFEAEGLADNIKALQASLLVANIAQEYAANEGIRNTASGGIENSRFAAMLGQLNFAPRATTTASAPLGSALISDFTPLGTPVVEGLRTLTSAEQTGLSSYTLAVSNDDMAKAINKHFSYNGDQDPETEYDLFFEDLQQIEILDPAQIRTVVQSPISNVNIFGTIYNRAEYHIHFTANGQQYSAIGLVDRATSRINITTLCRITPA